MLTNSLMNDESPICLPIHLPLIPKTYQSSYQSSLTNSFTHPLTNHLLLSLLPIISDLPIHLPIISYPPLCLSILLQTTSMLTNSQYESPLFPYQLPLCLPIRL